MKKEIFPDTRFSTCVCDCYDEEHALRQIIDGTWAYGPMTPEQREWCIDEADSAAEGAMRRDDLTTMTDQELARAVLDAWWAYVQSNCGL